jgi:hypothetical protein
LTENKTLKRESLFGTDSAEKDKFLNSYFIQTGTYRAVVNKEKLIVVGRKGSGKSAIFQYLKNDNNTVYIKLSPNKFSLDYFKQFENSISSKVFNGVMGFTAVWKYLILKEITSQLQKKSNNEVLTSIAEDSVSIMDSWIKSNIDTNSIFNFATKEISTELLEELPNSKENINVNLIRETLNQKKIHVLIDDLDFLWDNSVWCQNYISGLIECAFDLNSTSKISVTLFIREDIFTVIETKFHRIDNMRSLIENIVWTPILLKQLIARRIQTYFDLTPAKFKNDYWYFVFPWTVNNFDSFKYMVERTQLRPREIVQFCDKSYEISTRYKKKSVADLDITQAEKTYSDWKLSDLCSEYVTQYRDLLKLFKAFAGVKYDYPKNEIIGIIDSVLKSNQIGRAYQNETQPLFSNEMLQFLYDCGFLRAKVIDPSTGKKVYRGSSTFKNFNLHMVDEFDIHPAYRRALLG